MPFPSLRTEGGLIPADILEQIASGEAPGQHPHDFGLDKSRRLTDEIAAAWGDARAFWEAFQRAVARLPEDDPATTPTREIWIRPLLGALGYGELIFMPSAAIIEGQTYAISHRASPSPDPHPERNEEKSKGGRERGSGGEGGPPIHIVGCRADLDRRPPSGRPRLSPHALVQEYLNRTEFLWGVVTNGYKLRLLRDSSRVTRPQFVEFDLQALMQAESFADFALLYRLLHRTRLPHSADDAARCWLEQYHQQAIEAGGRVRDGLRDGVEEALKILGNGFLAHPANTALRARFADGPLSAMDYYRQLLRLIYRLLFLLVSEERGLIGADGAGLYQQFYSVSRLRALAESPVAGMERHGDLWLGLLATFQLFTGEVKGRALGLEPLNGGLFSAEATPDLDSTRLVNADLLAAVRRLSLYREKDTTRRVNYAALDVEELGSVYESLLDYHPVVAVNSERLSVNSADHRPLITAHFDLAFGSERKTTGSYYTRPELVHELIKSALEPVMTERLAAAPTPAQKEAALLSLKVCDPAAGSGHFLLAAARRIGRELARVRSGEDEPTPEAFRLAVRDVVQYCIYGVDLNPLAVDLCKLALWLESYAAGKPLTFLDHRLKWGNSLVGAKLPTSKIQNSKSEIPDEAFTPVAGDHKPTASALKKRNKAERSGQMSLLITELRSLDDLAAWAARQARQVADLPEDTAEQVHTKADAYNTYLHSAEYARRKLEADLWTAAFFWPMKDEPGAAIVAPTHGELLKARAGERLDPELVDRVNALAGRLRFFYWPIEFPEVFAGNSGVVIGNSPEPDPQLPITNYGFDCVLGNPPWERIKLQEEEFFAARDPEIANAPNKAARQKLIDALPKKNPALAREFEEAKHATEATSKFVRYSGRFPLTAVGDVNTYALFAELTRSLIAPTGCAGIIVPTGIATDDTTKLFFQDLMQSQTLVNLYDFENRRNIFPGVGHGRSKFCLITLAGSARQAQQGANFIFFAYSTDDLREEARCFSLSNEDLILLNPNTRTCPVFRTRADAELTKKIYHRFPVLVNEQSGLNPWGISFLRMFDMANDSHLFHTRAQLDTRGWILEGNIYRRNNERYLPLYEAKLIWHYDHRLGSFESFTERPENSHLPQSSLVNYQNPVYVPQTWYWVRENDVRERLESFATHKLDWLIGYRFSTSPTNERTMVLSVFPLAGANHILPCVFLEGAIQLTACFIANANSLVYDYVLRNKMGRQGLDYFFVKQTPFISPTAYTSADTDFIAPRVLELAYTAYDLKPFAGDMGYHGEPFRWDDPPGRRAQLRAELDAYYARLYGLTRDELRYILDPKDVYGPDFPGETFRVLKEKEIRLYGEYRTRRLVLGAWDKLETGIEWAEEIVRPLQPLTEAPVEVGVRQPLPEITWIPVTPAVREVGKKQPTPNYRQAVAIAWLLEHFGSGQSIPSFKAQKYSYFLQRADLADTDINFREFARGPYSPQVTYHAGAYAKKKSYWEVRGSNTVRMRNIREAVNAANKVIIDIEQARQLVERLSEMTEDDLGGLATVDYASREIHKRGQAITPENIRAYFRSDWPEKVSDPWYTEENITRALNLLNELELFEKSITDISDDA